jgi:hypothetical protein
MHRLNLRALALVIGGTVVTAVARADEPVPPPKPAKPAAVPVSTPELFRAATPYNATFVNRTLPNPANNRPNFTLPCESHQNFEPFVPARPECINKILNKKGCGCGGSADGGCSQGNCATCSNTYNFVWSGSRSYFGESSREFFERPPSVDAARHKWNPIPVLWRNEK